MLRPSARSRSSNIVPPNVIPNVRFRQMLMLPVSAGAWSNIRSHLLAARHRTLRPRALWRSSGQQRPPAWFGEPPPDPAPRRQAVRSDRSWRQPIAHRVFGVRRLLQLFEGSYLSDHFSFVDDAGDVHENVRLREEDVQSNLGCQFGCGILELTKCWRAQSLLSGAGRRSVVASIAIRGGSCDGSWGKAGERCGFLNLRKGLDLSSIPYRSTIFAMPSRHPEELACIVGKPCVLDAMPWRNPILFGAAVYSIHQS